MFDNKVKQHIEGIFDEMNREIEGIIKFSTSSSSATESIMNYVSSKITASSRGYVFDLYSVLSKSTLNESVFQDSANANKFYELNLRQKIADAYQFDIQDIRTYKEGLNAKEINRIYSSVAATVGSAAVGGILLGSLSGVINVPMVVIIAGAILAGVAGGSVLYSKVIPNYNKTQYTASVKSFMSSLKFELINWVDAIVEFYNQQVNELRKSL